MINDWKLDVGHLARALLAQRYFILFGTILLTLIGVALLSMKEEQYSASAMILVNDRGLNVPEAEAILEDGSADAESLLSHVELIKGSNVMRRAVKDLADKGVNLYDNADTSGGFLSSVAAAIPSELWPDKGSPAQGESELATRLSPELRSFASSAEVTALGRSKLIEVSFKHTEPDRAAAGANALANAYVNQQREEQVAIGNDAVQWMVEQAASLRKQSSAADQAVETFRRDSGLLQSGGSRLVEQKITETQTQLTAAELESIALGSKVQSIESALQRNNPFAVTDIADAESVRETAHPDQPVRGGACGPRSHLRSEPPPPRFQERADRADPALGRQRNREYRCRLPQPVARCPTARCCPSAGARPAKAGIVGRQSARR